MGPFPSVVAIAASTGGPQAVERLICPLPRDFPVPVLISQHMIDRFTGVFAERLNRLCQLEVREAGGREPLRPGLALVTPSGYHLTVNERGETSLNDGPSVNYVKPAADVMMASMADCLAPAVGIVLTGMGRDGARGARAIQKTGGWVIVQSPEEALISSMPLAAIKEGAASTVLPLAGIPTALLSILGRGKGGRRIEDGPVVLWNLSRASFAREPDSTWSAIRTGRWSAASASSWAAAAQRASRSF